MNRDRRKAFGGMLFDVAKYLLTSTAISTFVVQNINPVAFAVSVVASMITVAAAYFITPKDKEN